MEWEVNKGNPDSERRQLNRVLAEIEAGIGGITGVVASVGSGTGVTVDNTDPINPVVNLSAGSVASLALADSSVQPGDNVSSLVNDAGYATGGGTASGTNTGDQTSIVGITGSLAEFNAALTGADFATGGGTATGTNTGDQTITLTGDVTGSGAGSFAATIANDAVTYAKMQNVSATDKLLGRSTAGAGDVEEITCTAQGRALLDDALASDQRTTLGLGTIATQAATAVSITGGAISGVTASVSTLTVTQTIKRTGVLSPAQITANQNNYNPAGNATVSILRLDLDAARTITGLTSTAGASGCIVIQNISAFTLTLQHDDGATSAVQNRFLCPGSANFAIRANGSVEIIYDSVSSRWRVIAP